MAAARGRGRRGKSQVNRLFCKPICKPDAAKQSETGETGRSERDVFRSVRRGHRIRERLPETPETDIVWLITQRSQVQILPALPGSAGQMPDRQNDGRAFRLFVRSSSVGFGPGTWHAPGRAGRDWHRERLSVPLFEHCSSGCSRDGTLVLRAAGQGRPGSLVPEPACGM